MIEENGARETFEVDNKINTITAKCSNCGGSMAFSPTHQALKCEHCDTIVDIVTSKDVMELAIENAFNSSEQWGKEESVYRCESCGAEVIINNKTHATTCPYCDASHIVKSDDLVGLKPNAVYPFLLTEQQAVDVATVWAKKIFFAPRKFKKNLRAENIKGVYQPCFTFDSQTISYYKGRIGKRYTRVVGSGKNRRTETYIVWRNISGTYTRAFDDIMVNTTMTYTQKTLENLMPYDINTLVNFEQKLLTGYIAKRHEKDLPTSWCDAKSIMDGVLRKEILGQYSYDVVSDLNVDTTHSSVTYKYVLLPVYILNYKYRGKTYSLYVNGNTGMVTGKTPVSPLKIALTVLLGAIVVGGLAYLIYTYGN